MLEDKDLISTLHPKYRGSVRDMLSVALPMVLSLSFDTLMIFVDRIFLSKLGPQYMNAALAGGNANFMMMTLFFGLIGYSTAMVAQNLGAGRPERGAVVLTHALGIALVSYPILLLMRPLAYLMFDSFTVDPLQSEPQLIFFNTLLFGSIIPLFRHSFASYFSGLGKARVVMIASLVGMTINVALNYALIFGHWGAPPMGIRGAAIGSLCGGFAALCVLVFEFLRPSIRIPYKTLQGLHFDAKLLKEFIRKGTPSGVEMMLNLVAFQFMILLFQGKGIVNATAATIMFNWDMVSFVPLLGLEVAATSLVGRYVGARDFQAAERSTRSGILIGWGFSFFILIAFLGIPEVLVNVFRPDPMDSVFALASPVAVFMIRLAAVYVVIESIMVVYAGALRGAGDTFWTMCIMVGLHWFLVLLLWLVYHVWDLGARMAWGSMVAVFMAFPLLLWLRWRSGRWRTW
jgi:MATE family multidrug resistance protein